MSAREFITNNEINKNKRKARRNIIIGAMGLLIIFGIVIAENVKYTKSNYDKWKIETKSY